MTTAQKINNEIAESYCSFEVSKLLKEKGFNIITPYWYNSHGVTIENLIEVDDSDGSVSIGNILQNAPHTVKLYRDCCYMPTHAIAIEWIRVNFGIHIYIEILINVSEYVHRKVFSPAILEDTDARMGFTTFDSPQEATEAALLYTLKNLIP